MFVCLCARGGGGGGAAYVCVWCMGGVWGGQCVCVGGDQYVCVV